MSILKVYLRAGPYWDWRQNRNDARWQSQERGEQDYDAENMMHTFRLLLSGENILKQGVPIVRFEGAQLQLLLDIRSSKFPYDELIQMVDAKLKELDETLKNSNLPETADPAAIDRLFAGMTEEWEKST